MTAKLVLCVTFGGFVGAIIGLRVQEIVTENYIKVVFCNIVTKCGFLGAKLRYVPIVAWEEHRGHRSKERKLTIVLCATVQHSGPFNRVSRMSVINDALILARRADGRVEDNKKQQQQEQQRGGCRLN